MSQHQTHGGLARPGFAAWPWARTTRAVGSRLIGVLFVLWAVATLTFFGVRLIPGDPAAAIAGPQATLEQIEQIRVENGFDRPLVAQYLSQLVRLAQGDLGQSYAQHRAVRELVLEQIPATLILTASALVVAWLISVLLALIATRGDRASASIISAVEIFVAALPGFWLGTILIFVFSSRLQLLPAIGSGNDPARLTLPTLTLALPLAGFLGQTMRESFVDALEAPFALSARSRGETELGVRLIHALRHASIPGIQLSGWAFGALIGNAVIVETLFARPGIGRLLQASVFNRDVPVVVGVVLLIAAIYVVVSLVTDLVSRIVDPRLRAQ